MARPSSPGYWSRSLFEGGDDFAGVVSGAAVGGGDEDHAVVAGSAGGDGLVVEGAEVAEVVGDDGAVLGLGEGEDFGVGQGLAVGVAGDGFGVVASVSEVAGDGGGEHFVEEEFHRLMAACPAR